MSSPPRVFVSATSRDLGSYRKAVAEVLLTRDWHPVLQDHFGPDYRAVREMLRAKIKTCDAAICLIGWRYGEEPMNRNPGEPRRSYTQMEYDIAEELGKPIFRFFATEDCPADNPGQPPEDAERAALQRAYRVQIESSDRLRHSFDSVEKLLQQVRVIELPRFSNRSVRRAIYLGLVLLLVPAAYFGFTWALHRDPCAEPYLSLLTVADEDLDSFEPKDSPPATKDEPLQAPNSSPDTCKLTVRNETGRPIRLWQYFPDPSNAAPESGELQRPPLATKGNEVPESAGPESYQAWRVRWVCGDKSEELAANGWSFIYVEDLNGSLREARKDSAVSNWLRLKGMGWVYLPYQLESLIVIKKDFFDAPRNKSNFDVL